MDQPRRRRSRPTGSSPASEWAGLRADTPLTLTAEDVLRLQELNDPISLEEVVEIYLPLSRLLTLYVAATQGLYEATRTSSARRDGVTPYIIGIAGSVAVGKSTTARVLKALLGRWPNTPKVDLIATDGFLLPNAVLAREGLMERKGFPESYDSRRCSPSSPTSRPASATSRRRSIRTSSTTSCRARRSLDRPDILIVEGLNVLQTARLPNDGRAVPFVSDFFDFSVYLDADEDDHPPLVRRALPAAARHRLPRPALLFPPLRRDPRGRGDGDRRRPLEPDQPRQPSRKHPADPAAAHLILSKGASHRSRRWRCAGSELARHALDFSAPRP